MPEMPDLTGGSPDQIVYPWSSPPHSTDSALTALYSMTGIPDIVQATSAVGRGEYLQALGQGVFGALQAASLLPGPETVLRGLVGGKTLGLEAGMGRTTYHGTGATFQPVEHNPFGEFKDEYIGSGQGAQSYGYGHYVAGNPAVAKDMQQQLSGRASVPADEAGNPMKGLDIAEKFYEPETIVPGYGGQYDKVLGFTRTEDGRWETKVQAVKPKAESQGMNVGELLQQPEMWEPQRSSGPRTHATFPDDKNLSDVGQVRGWQMTQPGSLLEVHVKPEEHELLDWDKPLAEQSEGVRAALEKFDPPSDFTGQRIYNWLSQTKTFEAAQKTKAQGMDHFGREDQAASQALHEAGIPGIKYLDAGSRNLAEEMAGLHKSLETINANLQTSTDPEVIRNLVAQKEMVENRIKTANPTHNYVIFDPSNLRIIGRNGQRLDPVDHDPFAGPEPK